jgi:hypothetical protein
MAYPQPPEHQQTSSRSPSLEEEDEASSEQIGGGSTRRRRRSRSATPSETPTRLRMEVTPTTKAGVVTANALERRARLAPDEESLTPRDPPETLVAPHLDTQHPSIHPSNIPPSNPDPYAYLTRPGRHPHPSFTNPDAFRSGKQPTEADLQLFQTFLHVHPQLGILPPNYPLEHSHDVPRAQSHTPDPQAFMGPGIPTSNNPFQGGSHHIFRAPSSTPDPQAFMGPGIPTSNYPRKPSLEPSGAPSNLRMSSEPFPQLANDPVLSTKSSDLPIPTTQVIPATPTREHAHTHVDEPKANPRPAGCKSDDAKEIFSKGIKKLEEDIASLAQE